LKIRSVLAFALLVPVAAAAAPDASKGRRLVEQNKCESCHQRRVPGPVGTIYLRKEHKVTSWEMLKAQVAACNGRLGIGLFPDEEEDISAFLDQTYYRRRAK
jgi:hypothetical protein